MALQKTVNTNFGVDATYHHIGQVEVSYKQKTIRLVLFSYLDQAARLAGRQPLGIVEAQVSAEQFVFANNEPTRAELYAMLMTRPEWSDATAV